MSISGAHFATGSLSRIAFRSSSISAPSPTKLLVMEPTRQYVCSLAGFPVSGSAIPIPAIQIVSSFDTSATPAEPRPTASTSP